MIFSNPLISVLLIIIFMLIGYQHLNVKCQVTSNKHSNNSHLRQPRFTINIGPSNKVFPGINNCHVLKRIIHHLACMCLVHASIFYVIRHSTCICILNYLHFFKKSFTLNLFSICAVILTVKVDHNTGQHTVYFTKIAQFYP